MVPILSNKRQLVEQRQSWTRWICILFIQQAAISWTIDFYKVNQNVRWKRTGNQIFRGCTLFLSGWKQLKKASAV